jgi:hypothetical protein
MLIVVKREVVIDYLPPCLQTTYVQRPQVQQVYTQPRPQVQRVYTQPRPQVVYEQPRVVYQQPAEVAYRPRERVVYKQNDYSSDSYNTDVSNYNKGSFDV